MSLKILKCLYSVLLENYFNRVQLFYEYTHLIWFHEWYQLSTVNCGWASWAKAWREVPFENRKILKQRHVQIRIIGNNWSMLNLLFCISKSIIRWKRPNVFLVIGDTMLRMSIASYFMGKQKIQCYSNVEFTNQIVNTSFFTCQMLTFSWCKFLKVIIKMLVGSSSLYDISC